MPITPARATSAFYFFGWGRNEAIFVLFTMLSDVASAVQVMMLICIDYEGVRPEEHAAKFTV